MSKQDHELDEALLVAHKSSMVDPTEAMLRDDTAMVEWARAARPRPDSHTTVRGEDAAALGRALIAGAKRGRPALDPTRKVGEESPTVRFRVDAGTQRLLDAYIASEKRHGRRVNRSKVGREALVAYLNSHMVS